MEFGGVRDERKVGENERWGKKEITKRKDEKGKGGRCVVEKGVVGKWAIGQERVTINKTKW